MTVDGGSREFPYQQLATQYRERIQAGQYGSRLPSNADLADEAGVSPQTISKAIQVLKDEGLVESRPGRGVFVVGR